MLKAPLPFLRLSFCGGALLALSACAPTPETHYEKADWNDLPAWNTAQAADMLPVFLKSCDVYEQRPALKTVHDEAPIFGTYGDWHPLCKKARQLEGGDARAFFESRFELRQVSIDDGQGLFTGYYEPLLRGSFDKNEDYPVPLYRKPDSLMVADLGQFYDDLEGRRLVARVEKNRIVPFHTRDEIYSDALSERDVLVWVKDPINAFFLEVQGSGRVRLQSGQEINVGYAGKNGHPYVSIGRYMIDQGYLEQENVSLQTIRTFLRDNPDKMQEILEQNPSYVFFAMRSGGPFGSLGVPLTPMRSLAVDRAYVPLGVPVYVSTTLTAEGDKPLNLAMVAQDTGGAIKGAVRGDIFFGHGTQAELYAGKQNAPGKLYVLVPRNRTAPTPAQV